jgi:hypothetical protein
MCGPTMTSSFRERNPELKKNTRRNRGTETDNKNAVESKKVKILYVRAHACGNWPFWSAPHPVRGDHATWSVTHRKGSLYLSS